MENQTMTCIRAIFVVFGMACVVDVQAEMILQPDPYTFSWIWDSDAGPANGAIGEQQISFTVKEGTGGNDVIFRFANTSEQACSLTGIYFESSLGTLEGILGLDSGDGVSFSQGADPSNMPRWQKVNFEPTSGMAVDSDSPAVSQNGIDRVTEWLDITVETGAGLEQIHQELNDRSIRVGIHVQAFSDGGSESFITPEPATIALLGPGGFVLRKRRKIQKILMK